MKIWIYPSSKDKKADDGVVFLETTDVRLLVETVAQVVKNIDKYNKLKIEILNGSS